MKRLVILLAAVSAPALVAPTALGQEAIAAFHAYASHKACLADQAAVKSAGDRLDAEATALIQALLPTEGLIGRRNELWLQASRIGDVCSRIKQAERLAAPSGPSASDKAGMLGDMHELLAEQTLKRAVPNTTTRAIQERNLSTVRGQMGALAGDLDAALGALSEADFSSAGRASLPSPRIDYSKIPGQAAQLQKDAQAERVKWSNDARIAREQQAAAAAAQARAIENQIAQQRAMQNSYTNSSYGYDGYDASEEGYSSTRQQKSYYELGKDAAESLRPLIEAKRAREAAARAKPTTSSGVRLNDLSVRCPDGSISDGACFGE